jgi:hypothetical protein
MWTLVKMINTSGDLALITEGERRYGQVLFDRCSEVSRTSRRGRPPKTLPKGLQVRVKNQGSRAPKRGRKRPKYQVPCREHPHTSSAIENPQTHANHLEAFNASLRRRCAAYRRKTNTYAKKKKCLKPSLDVYWILHNFVRVHFITQHVPAVALSLIEQGLSLAEIFSYPHAFGIKRNQCPILYRSADFMVTLLPICLFVAVVVSMTNTLSPSATI